jgi:hypothetical protein
MKLTLDKSPIEIYNATAELSLRMYQILVNWLIDVFEYYNKYYGNYNIEKLSHTILILISYIHDNPNIKISMLQLVGITACVVTNIIYSINDTILTCDNAYTLSEMQDTINQLINYSINLPIIPNNRQFVVRMLLGNQPANDAMIATDNITDFGNCVQYEKNIRYVLTLESVDFGRIPNSQKRIDVQAKIMIEFDKDGEIDNCKLDAPCIGNGRRGFVYHTSIDTVLKIIEKTRNYPQLTICDEKTKITSGNLPYSEYLIGDILAKLSVHFVKPLAFLNTPRADFIEFEAETGILNCYNDNYVIQILYALDVMNSQGICHNDLHANNVMYRTGPSQRNVKYTFSNGYVHTFAKIKRIVKIIDFGFAIKYTNPRITHEYHPSDHFPREFNPSYDLYKLFGLVLPPNPGRLAYYIHTLFSDAKKNGYTKPAHNMDDYKSITPAYIIAQWGRCPPP